MAVTKTHPIKSTLKAAIDYILNPEKTDGKLLASSLDRKSTRLNSSHITRSRMPSSA